MSLDPEVDDIMTVRILDVDVSLTGEGDPLIFTQFDCCWYDETVESLMTEKMTDLLSHSLGDFLVTAWQQQKIRDAKLVPDLENGTSILYIYIDKPGTAPWRDWRHLQILAILFIAEQMAQIVPDDYIVTEVRINERWRQAVTILANH